MNGVRFRDWPDFQIERHGGNEGANVGDSCRFDRKLGVVPTKNGVAPGISPDARITFLDMLGNSLDRNDHLRFGGSRIIVDSVGRF
ncbi:MAG: hypothetical protein RLY14_3355 [Planctomycetota bacterium]|jgi:hypothetical protein